MSGVIKLGNITLGTENSGKVDLTNVGEMNLSSTNHTWTVKAIDEAIVGATNNTKDDADSGQLAIYNGTTKLWGITEHGYVVNSKVPYFHADKNNTDSQTATGEIVWNNTVLDNPAGSYNNTSGRFTAPVAGVYYFAFYVLKRGTSYIRLGFLLNGAQYIQNQIYQQNASGAEEMAHASIIMSLSAGDYVSVTIGAVGGGNIYGGGNMHNGFLGYLIG